MDTDKATIRQLFSSERRFLVPIFQRGYVWTQVGQWEPLWRDIVDQAHVVRRELIRPSPAARPPRKHFLGAIVIGEDQNRVLRVPTSGVIDGQQRLTTLQILLAAMRDAACGVDERAHKALAKLTTNDGDWPTDEDSFKLWPTNAYRSDFSLVMKAGSVNALTDAFPQRKKGRKWVPERPRMVECYLYFAAAIGNYIRGVEEWDELPPSSDATADPARLIELMEAVQSYLQLVTIELGREDDPQIIFETLNARGVELEPSDLVRNFVFLYAARTDGDPDGLYDAFWKPFDQESGPNGTTLRMSANHLPGGRPWWREKERQGRLQRERLDLFLFHYVTLRLNREIKIGHLFQEFRDWWEHGDVVIPVELDSPDGTSLEFEHDSAVDEQKVPGEGHEPRSAAKELARLRRAADDFRTLVSPDIHTPLGVFASRVKRVDTTTVYPLLLWVLERRAEVTDAELLGLFRDLESYLVRRMVCGLTNKNYNTIFLNLLRKLRRGGRVSRAALQRELMSLTGESSLWPDDKRFKQALVISPMYTTLGPVKTQLILEALDLAMEDPRSEHVVHSVLTVEHIMPQSSSFTAGDAQYPLPDDLQQAISRAGDASLGGSDIAEAKEREKTAQLRAMWIQSLGNLTLVTQRLNSSVGRHPFSVKRQELTQSSRLAINAEFQRMSGADAWNENAILERGVRLARIACQVWPHPTQGEASAT